MAASSVDTPSPAMASSCSSPAVSPSSDKRFWSYFRSRIDTLLDDRSSNVPTGLNPPIQINVGEPKRARATKEDSLLLMRGFDSIAHTLSQLSDTLENALQGANDLAKPPTLTEIIHSNPKTSESREESEEQQNAHDSQVGLKRKFDRSHCSEEQGDELQKEHEQDPKDGKLKKAKNLAISLATKAASFSRELKLIRSDLCFTQERCALLEEENRRLRDGFSKGLRPEEDDLVRLQLEALLAEKSRLANENANLVRENQCLNQLVEYHQLTSHDLSASYEQVIQGLCLDFSSPPPKIVAEGEADDEDGGNADNELLSQTPRTDLFSFSASLDDECSHEDH